MKKAIAMALALGLVGSFVFAGCSGSGGQEASEEEAEQTTAQTAEEEKPEDTPDDGAITLINGKAEIDAQMQQLASLYEEETGDKIEILSVGIDEKASDRVRDMDEKGETPDIFVCEASDFAEWEGRLEDLSGEEWNSLTQHAYSDADGNVLGFPYMVEACGLTYNKDILEQAGIDPEGLTSPEAYRSAFETLDGMKEALGLEGVVAYATNTDELDWSTGNHLFGQYLDAGLAPSDTTYIDLLNEDGSLDEARIKSFGEFVALLNQYSNADMLTEMDYGQQVEAFAAGHYAFITQGSWIGPLLTGTYADAYEKAGEFAAGIAPFAFEEGISTVLDGPTSYWAVYKDGNVEKAKQFLLWCSMDAAQQIFVDEAGLVSPFDNCPFEATDPLAASVKDWLLGGQYSAYHTYLKKEGLSDELGAVFYDFAKGDIADADGFAEALIKACTEYYHK